jgi:hypothetical protein
MKRILFFAIVIVGISCEPRQGQQVAEAPPQKMSNNHEIKVQEVLQANSYTYVKADENGKEVWLAILKSEVEVGKTYYYGEAMEMKNFQSKDLDRNFESILFLSGISESPIAENKTAAMMPQEDPHQKKEAVSKQDMNIQHDKGETSIAHLYDNKTSLKSKKVTVKGVVTKYNPGIMNRNWVHIQDGTGGENSFDLTITTLDQVSVGSIAKFEGVVAIDKDFGHGYKYDLILEEAIQLDKKSDDKPDNKLN